MKVHHESWPADGAHGRTIKMDCPFSATIRWRWGDRVHEADLVLYGVLEVSGRD